MDAKRWCIAVKNVVKMIGLNAVVIGSKHPSGKKNGTHRDGSGDEKSSQDGE